MGVYMYFNHYSPVECQKIFVCFLTCNVSIVTCIYCCANFQCKDSFDYFLMEGRFLIGLFQGSQQTLWRLYIGETSERAITFLPEEKRKKSTIKYTNFFIAFATASTNVAVGPCKSPSI